MRRDPDAGEHKPTKWADWNKAREQAHAGGGMHSDQYLNKEDAEGRWSVSSASAREMPGKLRGVIIREDRIGGENLV